MIRRPPETRAFWFGPLLGSKVTGEEEAESDVGACCVGLEGGAQVDGSVAQECAEQGAAQEGEVCRGISFSGPAAILVPGGVPAVVVAVLDHPVAADRTGEPGRICFRGRKAGEVIVGVACGAPVPFVDAGAGDRDRLGGMEEADLVGGARRHRHFPGLYPPVSYACAGKKGGCRSTSVCRDLFTAGVLSLIWST